MAYCTVKLVFGGVWFPGCHLSTFCRFKEEKTTSTGEGGEQKARGERDRKRERQRQRQRNRVAIKISRWWDQSGSVRIT